MQQFVEAAAFRGLGQQQRVAAIGKGQGQHQGVVHHGLQNTTFIVQGGNGLDLPIGQVKVARLGAPGVERALPGAAKVHGGGQRQQRGC